MYNEEIHDLLSKTSTNLVIKERPDVGVCIKELSTFIVNNADDMERIMITGNRRRELASIECLYRISKSDSHASLHTFAILYVYV